MPCALRTRSSCTCCCFKMWSRSWTCPASIAISGWVVRLAMLPAEPAEGSGGCFPSVSSLRTWDSSLIACSNRSSRSLGHARAALGDQLAGGQPLSDALEELAELVQLVREVLGHVHIGVVIRAVGFLHTVGDRHEPIDALRQRTKHRGLDGRRQYDQVVILIRLGGPSLGTGALAVLVLRGIAVVGFVRSLLGLVVIVVVVGLLGLVVIVVVVGLLGLVVILVVGLLGLVVIFVVVGLGLLGFVAFLVVVVLVGRAGGLLGLVVVLFALVVVGLLGLVFLFIPERWIGGEPCPCFRQPRQPTAPKAWPSRVRASRSLCPWPSWQWPWLGLRAACSWPRRCSSLRSGTCACWRLDRPARLPRRGCPATGAHRLRCYPLPAYRLRRSPQILETKKPRR